MDRPRFQKTEAIVLKHVNIGEADRIVTLYTPHAGKVRAVARGVRRPRSRLAGHLELLTGTQVLLHRGKSLDVISQSETTANNLPLRGDLWRMTCGLYMGELVERFTQEHQENAALYNLLRDSLATLGSTPNVNLLLRYFELRLLDLTGYHPELGRCVECEQPLAPITNYFSAAAGGVLCPDCRHKQSQHRPISLNALKVLRLMASSSFEAACRVKLPEGLSVELEGTMRQYIRYVLDQEVKSTEFLDLLRREQVAGR